MNTESPTRQRKPSTSAGTPSQPQKIEYIYHWNRIIGALAVLLVLIGLIGFAIHSWISPGAGSGNADVAATETAATTQEVGSTSQELEVSAPAADPVPAQVASAIDAVEKPGATPPSDRENPALAESTENDASRVFLQPDTRVNLRAAPSLSSPVLRILEPDAELTRLETGEFFYRVRSAEGVVGWVSRDFSSVTPYSAPARQSPPGSNDDTGPGVAGTPE